MGNQIKRVASNNIKSFFALLLCVGVLSCNNAGKDMEITKEPTISTFYLIRHAEKDRTDTNNVDPELIQEGLHRAIKWAEVFDNIPLDAIYSTNYERTIMTAAPTSVKKDITVQYYDPKELDIEAFKMKNEGLNVLIVGHSNTTPDFTNKLLGQDKYENMDDNDNASLFIVRIIDGQATEIRLKID